MWHFSLTDHSKRFTKQVSFHTLTEETPGSILLFSALLKHKHLTDVSVSELFFNSKSKKKKNKYQMRANENQHQTCLETLPG